MAKKIKLPLEMANGVAARTLEELKENWDLEKIMMYYQNGRLQTWLNDRYYNELAEQVNTLSDIIDPTEKQKKLCAIFGVPFTETSAVDMDIVIDRSVQLEKLRKVTADDKVLKNADKVAFNQEELANLLDEGKETIYLVNNTFSIPLTEKNKQYIGIGKVIAVINSKEPVDFRSLNIRFQNIQFDEAYEKTRQILEELAAAEKAHIEGRYKEAFAMFLKLAAKENGRAMYFIGEYYRQSFGNIVPQNEEIVFTWHKLGENRGDVLAGFNVAYCYPSGSPECEKLFKKYFGPLKELADKGDVIAQSEIANVYRAGYGIIEKDPGMAIIYLKKSAEGGYGRSANILGNIYYGEENYKEAVRWYRKAAELNDGWGNCNLAEMYRDGEGVVQNYEEAVKLYKRAVELGNSKAMNQLGILYHNGQGVERDDVKSAYWYRRAAEAGNEWGMYNLAKKYRDGEGVAQNCAIAAIWYKKAADLDNCEAMNELANFYYNGKGVDQSYEDAMKWRCKAAELGDKSAMDWVAFFYYKGYGVSQDYAKAMEWWKKGAEAGNGNCAIWIGDLYRDGKGVAKSKEEAKKWYEKAEELGDEDAADRLNNL